MGSPHTDQVVHGPSLRVWVTPERSDSGAGPGLKDAVNVQRSRGGVCAQRSRGYGYSPGLGSVVTPKRNRGQGHCPEIRKVRSLSRDNRVVSLPRPEVWCHHPIIRVGGHCPGLRGESLPKDQKVGSLPRDQKVRPIPGLRVWSPKKGTRVSSLLRDQRVNHCLMIKRVGSTVQA